MDSISNPRAAGQICVTTGPLLLSMLDTLMERKKWMSERRTFLKQAGLLGLTPLSTGTLGWPGVRPGKGQSAGAATDAENIVLENAEMRLAINPNGSAESLIHKPTGQECLAKGADAPMFTVTQYRPYDNELQLSYPARITHFPADQVRREGDRLIVSFALVGYEAAIDLKITDAYIAFKLESLTYKGYTSLRKKWQTPIDETLFVQLPVRNRRNLGEWLNVMWDEEVAVNLLATDPYAQIDAKARRGYRLFQAGTVRDVRLEGVGAALIATATPRLLDRIARVEEDFNLPRGVESRQRKEYKYSYYEVLKMTPQDADRHIKFAKMGGFRTMQIYYRAFAKAAGHFQWRPEYPNGMRDLKDIISKIDETEMIPGCHIHYNKVEKTDPYVTPVPDPRLNLSQIFTLAAPVDAISTVITVEENPQLCTMDDRRRFLRIVNELIEYDSFTTTPPYRFQGCKRAALGTQPGSYVAGAKIGQLDISREVNLVLITQNTDMQHEIAVRWGEIYREAGFRFIYYDGAQDVPPPYWFTVSRAQWLVYQQWDPTPLWAEGACKSHFSWHILTRGNAFDVFKPEVMKSATRAYPAAEIPRVKEDFTSINFGWIGYWAPGPETIGTQPDMLEYVTSRAAGWDCPISLVGDLPALETHPRTPDNLEVLRRWEDIRAQSWLTQQQKMALRNLKQEHTLLVNEHGKFELVPCEQIERVAGAKQPGRAFLFSRNGNVWVAYWHTSGSGVLEIPLEAKRVRLMRELGKPLAVKGSGKVARLPLGERRYLECEGLARQEVIAAFQNAKILSG